ncbi:probable sucrose-phosphate synthase 1 [Manihot esculenta]|uniref:probable sucrose-phosphate synthase 1 n=1 Tax=Manihot esculenta TaxID=3983 RepID=UPI001CC5017E|nr:probable sucrose-phosphate synthase 1 [Manihot esculenta]
MGQQSSSLMPSSSDSPPAHRSLGPLKQTEVTLQLADRSIIYPKGVLEDVLVQVEKLIFLIDFFILDMEDNNSSNSTDFLLGRPFLSTARTKIDVHEGTLTMEFDEEEVKFNVYDAMKYPDENFSICSIDVIEPLAQKVFELSKKDKLEVVLTENLTLDYLDECTTQFHEEIIETIHSLDTPYQKAPEIELKALPTHLKYVFLGKENTLPVIVSNKLSKGEEDKLVQVLKEYKEAVRWIIADLKGLSPSTCMHKILLEENSKPKREAQRRLNLPMMEVVKKDILKLLDARIIYPILDSRWQLSKDVIKLIGKYDLYGHVAYPKHHKQSDVPNIYRLAAKTKGVFVNPAFIEPFGLTLIEAATHGLPIVATKNGGPVDIHQVLDNGLLVDPHDQQSIVDALLKLVSGKQLWARCRQNGLKNIHLFSWPEHCKIYLARIASCKPRQPKWKRSEAGLRNEESDSPGDSLRDIKDLSLKLSLDGDKNESENLDNSLDTEENASDRKNVLGNNALTLSKDAIRGAQNESIQKADNNICSSKFPSPRKRKYIFVIAVDGDTTSDSLEAIKKVVEVGMKETSIGFILATSMTISEVYSLLASGGLSPLDFDAFIYNSGSEVYYPSLSNGDIAGLPFVLDLDYHSHIEYHWGGEGLINDKHGQEQIVVEDESGSTAHCCAFKVKEPSMIPSLRELRKLMRIQGFRGHVIYENAYVLDLSHDMKISKTFNVTDIFQSRKNERERGVIFERENL